MLVHSGDQFVRAQSMMSEDVAKLNALQRTPNIKPTGIPQLLNLHNSLRNKTLEFLMSCFRRSFQSHYDDDGK
jgi:hypothetical protein